MDPFKILEQNYDKIFSGHYSVGSKHYIGPEKPTKCRFCDKSPPDVSFKNNAHAIPELLGNRQLIVTNECDSCNTLFSESLEDHLGKFTKPYRLLGQVKGKEGTPSYKTPSKLSRIDLVPGEGLEIKETEGDPLTEIAQDKNQIMIHFVLERHVPSAVYKSLVKVALSVMPEEELSEFELTKRWIRHRDHKSPLMLPLNLMLTFVPGPRPYQLTSILLLRKKAVSPSVELPHCLLIVAFGNLQLQIMVPALSDKRNEGATSFTIPRFPTPFDEAWPYGAPKPAIIDLSSGEIAESRPFTLTMHFDRMGEKEGSS